MRFISIICLFLTTSSIIAQTEQETRNISTLCKVWGFLKYYHPEVAKGKMDWDKEFMIRVKTASALKSKEETSKFYLEWIESLGKVKKCKKCKDEFTDLQKRNCDFDFIEDSTQFESGLIQKLLYIRENRNQERNHYFKPYGQTHNFNFDSEAPYKDSLFPSLELRLLGLSRFWNIYNYFFPYMYLNDYDWNETLMKMIPVFFQASNEKEYLFAVMELTGKVSDSHAGLGIVPFRKAFGELMVPIKFKIIDEKIVISDFTNDSLAKKDDLMLGDQIVQINGKNVSDLIKEYSKFIAYSNIPILYRKMWNVLLNGFTDSLQITYERINKTETKWIRRYPTYQMIFSDSDIDTFKILEGNIGYVFMGYLEKKDVDSMMKKLWDTKAIIFDIRNYPQGTMYEILTYLSDEFKPFASFTYPNQKYPGMFTETEKPMFCGTNTENPYYKEKVVVLFNEETQSHAEFTAMSFKTIPGVVCIGSQTSGADGNCSPISFPGGYASYLTGLGVYYPDGRETQRIGIVPDIEVKSTIQGIQEGRDEVLEKAIEIINK